MSAISQKKGFDRKGARRRDLGQRRATEQQGADHRPNDDEPAHLPLEVGSASPR